MLGVFVNALETSSFPSVDVWTPGYPAGVCLEVGKGLEHRLKGGEVEV